MSMHVTFHSVDDINVQSNSNNPSCSKKWWAMVPSNLCKLGSSWCVVQLIVFRDRTSTEALPAALDLGSGRQLTFTRTEPKNRLTLQSWKNPNPQADYSIHASGFHEGIFSPVLTFYSDSSCQKTISRCWLATVCQLVHWTEVDPTINFCQTGATTHCLQFSWYLLNWSP